jgi:hypothetical protein
MRLLVTFSAVNEYVVIASRLRCFFVCRSATDCNLSSLKAPPTNYVYISVDGRSYLRLYKAMTAYVFLYRMPEFTTPFV